LIVENEGGDVAWTEPRDLDFGTMNMSLAAHSANGVSSRFAPPAVVTVDDTVRTLSMDLSPTALEAMLTANGREDVAIDDQGTAVPDARKRPLKSGATEARRPE
jgi:hypothetical protein